MKKALIGALSAIMALTSLSSCAFLGGGSGSGNPQGWQDYTDLANYVATEYNNEAVVEADETEAGDVDSWAAEVYTKTGGNNDMVTNNGIIKSPWHTLKVNGKKVPVYTARCGKGPHSFAWLDVTSSKKDFALKIELTMDEAYPKCVVLPESKNVVIKQEAATYTSYLTKYGSFTYTFSDDASAEFTDPTLAPLTIMVTKEQPLKIPDGYETREIEPGYYDINDLNFKDEETVYVMKEGLHEISSVSIPSNSILYLERGAYLKVTDRMSPTLGQNRDTAMFVKEDSENAHIISRGLMDCGGTRGGDGKFKHVVNMTRCQDSTIEGLTLINANTWSFCFYNCDNIEMNRNLLLSYRTYSDGLMMSECRNSSGRYNFVRTGDDGIEYKGTGWGGKNDGYDCIYEYNDCWTDKGSAYGLTWESDCNMSNMVFKNNTVGFAQPTWNGGNNALDVRLGTNPEKRWGDVTFEDIEIYFVVCPNVITTTLSGKGAIMENILFKDITIKGTEWGTYLYAMHMAASGGYISNIRLENINLCGKKITAADKDDPALFNNQAPEYFDSELTVK